MEARAAAMVPPVLIAERYRVDELLAEGGVGRVYRVTDLSRGSSLALKRLRPDASERVRALFELEYQTLASLRHPHMVEVYDYGRDAGAAFYTMELLEGGDLREHAPMPWREACVALRDAAQALQVLHARSLVHRDVSARNLWRGHDGTVKLIDFGALAHFGKTEQVIGTPPLLPPEAFHGRALDQRSDLYSLGAVGYYLLTGRNAYPAAELAELPELWRSPPPPPSALVEAIGRPDLPPIPPELDLLLLGLLSEDPVGRPNGTAELIDRVDSLLSGGVAESRHDSPELRFANVAFVGRSRELRRLRRHLWLAARSREQSVLIEGEASSGRSRLLQQLALDARVADAVVLHVDAAGYPDLYGVAGALALKLVDALPQAARAHAKPHAVPLAHVSGALRLRLGAPQTPPPDAVGELRLRIQTALCDWFIAVAQQHTLVVLVDGLERVDEASIAFLLGLARSRRRGRLLLACTVLRESLRTRSPAERALEQASHRTRLSPLDEAAGLELLQSVFGRPEHLSRLASSLHRSARGSPGHMLELAAQLVRSETIRLVEGTWVLPQELPDAQLAGSLRQAFALRLARVTGPARELARVLSVQSGAISPELCTAIAGPAETIEPLIEALRELEIMTRDEDGLRFSHEQYRTALLAELAAERKSKALRALGTYLLALPECGALERLRGAVHLVESGDRSAIPLVTAAATDIALRDPDRLAPAVPVIEHALQLFRASGRPPHELSALLGPLAIAGYFADHRYAFRYGEEALASLQVLVGLDRAARLRPLLGRRFALLAALACTAAIFLWRRRSAPAPSFGDALTLLFMTASALAASNALVYDFESTRRAAAALEPFAALGPRLAPAFAHDVCVGLATAVRDTFGESRARWQSTVARLESSETIVGLPDHLRVRYQTGLMFAMGIMDAQRDDDRSLRLADQLDGMGVAFYPMSTDQLRSAYHAHNGNAKRYAYYRERAEQRAIQQGAIWQNETWTLLVETVVALRHHDAMAMKRVSEQLRSASKVIPTLAVYADRSRGAYLLMRERHAEALPWLERCLSEETRLNFGWGRSHGVLARAYNELGRHEEARDACERVLKEFTPADLEFPGITLLIETERLVAEAGLGGLAAARERLARLLDLHRANEGPLTMAELHDAGLRVALLARDEADARLHCERMVHWCAVTGIPSLVQRSALACARMRAMFEGPVSAGSLSLRVAGDTASAVTTAVSSRPAG